MSAYTSFCPNCHGHLVKREDGLYYCTSCRGLMTEEDLKHNPVRRNDLWRQANEAHEQGEYDHAIQLLQECLAECGEDAYTHWLILLSLYGIDYVNEDGEKKPTLNRMSLLPILSDLHYKKAMELAPPNMKESCEKVAKDIEAIQNEFFKIQTTLQPYDVFISYKETEISNPNQRTEDSRYAQKIYDALEKKGRSVFLARITLHKQYLGRNYEAVIFSALNSARVMILVGTSLENINSRWVRNEWSRYLKLRQRDGVGGGHEIIVAYRDIHPEQLPNGMNLLEGQDLRAADWESNLINISPYDTAFVTFRPLILRKYMGKAEDNIFLDNPPELCQLCKEYFEVAETLKRSMNANGISVIQKSIDEVVSNLLDVGKSYYQDDQFDKSLICFEAITDRSDEAALFTAIGRISEAASKHTHPNNPVYSNYFQLMLPIVERQKNITNRGLFAGACHMVAEMYRDGFGTNADIDRAYLFESMASSYGNEEAQAELRRYKKKLFGGYTYK